MSKLFSYVVVKDSGLAPNPDDGLCSLAKCKFRSKKGRGNIVEMAEKGNWIAGRGGRSKESAGHGKLIYAMRVDKKISLEDYCRDNPNRIDAEHVDDERDRFALLSNYFFYSGQNAIEIPANLLRELEKPGRPYRCDFSEKFIEDFVAWLEATHKVGKHGEPWVIRDRRRECPSRTKICSDAAARKC